MTDRNDRHHTDMGSALTLAMRAEADDLERYGEERAVRLLRKAADRLDKLEEIAMSHAADDWAEVR